MPTAAAIRHVHFEDLGTLADLLRERGYGLHYLEAGLDRLDGAAARDADLLVVLGGPLGANELEEYPFLREELATLEARLRSGRPTLGICLGAQLMARALGARVAPGPAKEIGWAPLELTDAGRDSCLRHATGPVLHWHGDRFELPPGATRLAATAATPNQAFALGPHALALQFHLEARADAFEPWLIGHACELAAAGLAPAALRAQARRHGDALATAARATFGEWLDALRGRA